MSLSSGVKKAFLAADSGDFREAFRLLYKHAYGVQLRAPSSVVLDNGTSSDAVADVQAMLDGNVYQLAEAAGTPGQRATFTFTGINEIYGLVVRAYYLGSSTHHCELQLFNYNTSAWDVFLTYESGSGYNVRYVLVPDDAPYISVGAAQIRWEHPDAGNASHDAFIDYIGIQQ